MSVAGVFFSVSIYSQQWRSVDQSPSPPAPLPEGEGRNCCMVLAILLIFVFMVGASVGSFLNVSIARLPLEKSLLWPNSRCGSCLQSIRWYDNIPLLSYLCLRGRCRTCGQSY